MKNNFRKAALSTICMLLVAVMSLTGATYAWFTAGEEATVTGMQLDVSTADGGIQVREVIEGTTTTYGNWATTLNLGLNKASVDPVSTINGTDFFKVAYNPANQNQIAVVEADKDADVVVKKIQLANSGTEDITIDLGDSVISAATNGTTGLEKDIFEAARVAIITSEKTYIWSANEEASYYGLKAVTPEDTYIPVYADGGAYTQSVTVSTNSTVTIKLPKVNDANELNPVDVTIVIWLEGQDADCINTNAGGAFSVSLNFAKQVTD